MRVRAAWQRLTQRGFSPLVLAALVLSLAAVLTAAIVVPWIAAADATALVWRVLRACRGVCNRLEGVR